MVLKSEMDDVRGLMLEVEAMDAELLLRYLKWSRLNSAGSIRWWKGSTHSLDTKSRGWKN